MGIFRLLFGKRTTGTGPCYHDPVRPTIRVVRTGVSDETLDAAVRELTPEYNRAHGETVVGQHVKGPVIGERHSVAWSDARWSEGNLAAVSYVKGEEDVTRYGDRAFHDVMLERTLRLYVLQNGELAEWTAHKHTETGTDETICGDLTGSSVNRRKVSLGGVGLDDQGYVVRFKVGDEYRVAQVAYADVQRTAEVRRDDQKAHQPTAKE